MTFAHTFLTFSSFASSQLLGNHWIYQLQGEDTKMEGNNSLATPFRCHSCGGNVAIVGGELRFCQSLDCEDFIRNNKGGGTTPECLRAVVCEKCHNQCHVCKKHFCLESQTCCLCCGGMHCPEHEKPPCVVCGGDEKCSDCTISCDLCVEGGFEDGHCPGCTAVCHGCKKNRCRAHCSNCWNPDCDDYLHIEYCYNCIEKEYEPCPKCKTSLLPHDKDDKDCSCFRCSKK